MNKTFAQRWTARKQTPRAEFLYAHNEARLARCWRDKGDVAAKIARETALLRIKQLILAENWVKISGIKILSVRLRAGQ